MMQKYCPRSIACQVCQISAERIYFEGGKFGHDELIEDVVNKNCVVDAENWIRMHDIVSSTDSQTVSLGGSYCLFFNS